MTISTRALKVAALLVALALLAPPLVAAEISDSPEPLEIGNLVVVGVDNPEEISDRGMVVVTAILVDGTTATKSVPFQLDAKESRSFEVAFKGGVDQIVTVQITEGPDPIPH